MSSGLEINVSSGSTPTPSAGIGSVTLKGNQKDIFPNQTVINCFRDDFRCKVFQLPVLLYDFHHSQQ